MSSSVTSVDQLVVDTLRFLSVDMVEAANSGHPGLPLGAAPMLQVLFGRIMKFHPGRPDWFDRDRFILSPGHGSALLYAGLHVYGYELGLEELKNFRQLGSKTPGHPEYGMTPGVECTTGPLGQGFANGVGMAIAEAWLGDRFNKGGAKVVDHHIYGIVSDGDLMEGVAQEAASLAGHLGLGKIVYLYDSNDISLDGPCEWSYAEDVRGKYEAMGWHVQEVADGNDLDVIERAILEGKAVTDKPSLIIVKTVIGYGSPKAGTSKAHGSPLGEEATKETKKALGWAVDETFVVPEELKKLGEGARERGQSWRAAWEGEVNKLRAFDSGLGKEYNQVIDGQLPEGWDSALNELRFDGKMATRDAGKAALNAIAGAVPWLVGGSADLVSSTKTEIIDSGKFSVGDVSGRNVFFGVREHAMGAIVNGMNLHGLRSFGSTFLVFSDYMRGAMRLAALSHLKSLFIFTHDSVFVGEDGPTHQPVEHVSALRLIPGMKVWRPGDAYETAEAYRQVMASGKSACMVLTRQGVPVLETYRDEIAAGVEKGGYVLKEAKGELKVVLLATGSEVGLALEACEVMENDGIGVRVVSMPCRERFVEQPWVYRDSVLPREVATVSLEAGVTPLWSGMAGASVGIDRFGESGPGGEVYEHLDMTVDAVVDVAKGLLS